MRERISSRRKRLKMKSLVCGAQLVLLLGLFTAALVAVTAETTQGTNEPGTRNHSYGIGAKDSRGLFSPRMDYDQWKPLGRGDPLQNDPTYDYVPPVLERVHYWVEPIARKDGPPQHEGKKSEILVLGVSSKKPSTSTVAADNRRDSYESFLKFMEGPKYYHHHHHNSYNRPNPNQRQHHGNYHSQYYKSKYDDGGYKPDEQRMPYTVLVPPPIPSPHMEMPLFKQQNPPPTPPPITQRPVYKPTTTAASRPAVSVQESNLIYHSSSSVGNNQWQQGNNQGSSVASGSQYVSWKVSTETPPKRNIIFQENANKNNPIVFTRNSSENFNQFKIPQSSGEANPYNLPLVFPSETSGRIVFEQHSSYDPASYQTSSGQISHIPGISIQPLGRPDNSQVHVPLVLAPTSPALHVLHVAGTQPAITHMAVGNQPMHKGQVSDDTIGNTYVNIGKPNAHIQKEVTTSRSPILTVSQHSSVNNNNNDNAGATIIKPILKMPLLPVAYPSNQINSVYTSGHGMNKPMINNGVPFSRRPGPITDDFTLQTMQTMQPPQYSIKTTEKPETVTKKATGFFHSILQKEISTESPSLSAGMYTPITSTVPTPTTTAVASLTTDPLFKHYKQPAEPLRGPMYLIIQGHSKVKTYGAGNKDLFREVVIPENNEIVESAEKYPVKHLHNHREKNTKDVATHSRAKNSRTLKDLVDDGVGNLDVQETEIGVKYKVSDGKTATTSEKYYKGIVESEENDMIEIHKRRNSIKKREKRQLEEFIPVVEDTVETFIYDFLKRQSEGSGVGAIIASAITNDSSEDYNNDEESPINNGGL